MVHNHYQQPGGEDQSFAAEVELLRQHGHEVRTYIRHNDELKRVSAVQAARTAIWNSQVYKELRGIIREFSPDVVHVQNFFAVVSPACFYAAKAEGVTVLQTLHNYRMICPSGQLFRVGQICELCVAKAVRWPGVIHGCYRNSRIASAVRFFMFEAHRLIGLWDRKVDGYIALTEFGKQKFIDGGISGERIYVKGNFVFDSNLTKDVAVTGRRGILFVGRLSDVKGIHALVDAWTRMPKDAWLTVIGDGPLSGVVRDLAKAHKNVSWLGQSAPDAVLDHMRRAVCVLFPSVWYEGMPRTIIESFMMGTPVIASNIGAMATMIEDKRTGLHVSPGDSAGLAQAMAWAIGHPGEMAQMGFLARKEYEAKYSPRSNYETLIKIYQAAMRRNGKN